MQFPRKLEHSTSIMILGKDGIGTVVMKEQQLYSIASEVARSGGRITTRTFQHGAYHGHDVDDDKG